MAVGAVYLQVVEFGAIPVWDDGKYLVSRAAVTEWWQVPWRTRLLTPELGYPVPVPTFVYAHVRLLVPDAYPQVLHGLNVVLHLGNCLLVYRLVERWLGRRYAWGVMALWGLHPVNVETVAWLTNLKTLLAGTFAFGTMLAWERVLDAEDYGTVRWIGTAGGLLLLALGCRPDAAVVVLILVAQTARAGGTEGLRRRAGFLAALAVFAGVVVAFGVAGHGGMVERASTNAPSFTSRILRVARAFELSVSHLVWPLDLEPGYFLPADKRLLPAVPGLVAIGLFGLCVAGLAFRRRGWLFPLVLFGILYAPYSNLRFLPRFTADTYLYLPSFAFVLTPAWWIDAYADKGEGRGPALALGVRRTLAIGAVGIGLVFALISHNQAARWKNAVTLWAPVMERHPDVHRPYTLVALSKLRSGEWETARKLVERALPLYRRTREYPFFLPLVFQETGGESEAVALAREMIREGADPGPKHDKVFADLLARNEAPLPSEEALTSALDRALELYRRKESWLAVRDDRLAMADYLTKVGRHEASVPFLAREFRAAQPHCFAWIAAERLPPDLEHRLEPPPVPMRCR